MANTAESLVLEAVPHDDVPPVPAFVDEKPVPSNVKEPEVNKLFRMVMKHEASDLHLKVGQPPMMRLRGDIRRVDMRPLSQEDMERLLLTILTPRLRKILDDEGGCDFSWVDDQDHSRLAV